MAGTALVGLGSISTLTGFYFFYLFNAIGYVFGGPLPNQVLLSRWFTASRGKAMGFAYLGIGLGGALVPLIAVRLVAQFGWQGALKALGVAHRHRRAAARAVREGSRRPRVDRRRAARVASRRSRRSATCCGSRRSIC